MKVLHVSAGNLYGGVETVLLTFARSRSLVPDFEPEFAVCFPGRLRDELSAAGVPVHDLGPVRLSRPWTVMRAGRRLRSIVRAGGHAAVLCHMPWAQAVFGRPAAATGAMSVAYFHGAAAAGWPETLAKWTRPSLVIAPSRFTLDTTRTVFPTVPGEVVYNPLPPSVRDARPLSPDQRAAIRSGFGAADTDVVILQASRVEALKGLDLVVRALQRLRHIPGWQFWFAGGPQRPSETAYFAELRAMVAASGIADRVRFLGQRSDVPDLMRAADVYTQGNRGPEGFSLSFLEASYSGLPVVTTDLGGAGEMIDASTGVLVPPEAEDLLSDALHQMIRDPGRRARLGAAAREKATALCDPARQLARLRDLVAKGGRGMMGVAVVGRRPAGGGG